MLKLSADRKTRSKMAVGVVRRNDYTRSKPQRDALIGGAVWEYPLTTQDRHRPRPTQTHSVLLNITSERHTSTTGSPHNAPLLPTSCVAIGSTTSIRTVIMRVRVTRCFLPPAGQEEEGEEGQGAGEREGEERSEQGEDPEETPHAPRPQRHNPVQVPDQVLSPPQNITSRSRP